MSRQRPEKVSVTFHDVCACFSEEEWKLLHEWQKELYKTVMKELHQALISIGPLIATSVFSLRPAEKQEVRPMDLQDSNRTLSIINSSNDPIPNPDALFGIKREEHPHLKNPQYTEGREMHDFVSTDYPFLNPDICLRKEDETHARLLDQCQAEGGETSTGNTSGFPYLDTDFCLRHEDESPVSLIGHPGSEGGESSTDPSSDHAVIPEVICVHIKEEQEDDTYSMDHQDSEILEIISSQTRDGSMKRQMKIGESIKRTKKTSSYKASSGKKNSKVLKSSYKGTNSRSQLLSENYQETSGENTTQCESGFSHSEHINVYHERPKKGISQQYNECERNLRNSPFIDGLPNTEQNQTPYTSSEYDKSYSLKGELIKQMGAHSGVKPYACSDCEKSYFRKKNLILHYRTHTGEKPYACAICHKRFSRKDNLNRHKRIHTGVEGNWGPATCNAEPYPSKP